MKVKKSYTISSKEEDEINKILETGLNEVNFGNSPKTKSLSDLNKEIYPVHTKFINNDPCSFPSMRNDLRNLQNNINKFEQKLFRSNNISTYSSNIRTSASYSKFPTFTTGGMSTSCDYKEKLAQKENEILNLKLQIQQEQRDKECLQGQIDKMTQDISNINIKFNDCVKENTKLKEYKHDYEKLQADYHKLLQEYKCSEEIRNNQKVLIRNLQSDIDEMRKASYNRISQIEMNYKLTKQSLQEENKSEGINKNIQILTKTKEKKKKQKKIIHKKRSLSKV